MTEIRKLTLADRDTVTSHLQRFPREISEHTFTNLFVWRHYRKIFYLQVEETIAFVTKEASKEGPLTLFGPPVGILSLEDMLNILGDSLGEAIRIPSSAVVSLNRDISLCGEFQAIRDSFRYFNELKLLGGAIRINGTVEAFAIGEQLHPGTGVCYFEKASRGFTGLGQLINNQFARNGLQGFKYINREQDLGIKGIRQTKESYHPDHLVMKHTIGPASQLTWQPGCVSDSEQGTVN